MDQQQQFQKQLQQKQNEIIALNQELNAKHQNIQEKEEEIIELKKQHELELYEYKQIEKEYKLQLEMTEADCQEQLTLLKDAFEKEKHIADEKYKKEMDSMIQNYTIQVSKLDKRVNKLLGENNNQKKENQNFSDQVKRLQYQTQNQTQTIAQLQETQAEVTKDLKELQKKYDELNKKNKKQDERYAKAMENIQYNDQIKQELASQLNQTETENEELKAYAKKQEQIWQKRYYQQKVKFERVLQNQSGIQIQKTKQIQNVEEGVDEDFILDYSSQNKFELGDKEVQCIIEQEDAFTQCEDEEMIQKIKSLEDEIKDCEQEMKIREKQYIEGRAKQKREFDQIFEDQKLKNQILIDKVNETWKSKLSQQEMEQRNNEAIYEKRIEYVEIDSKKLREDYEQQLQKEKKEKDSLTYQLMIFRENQQQEKEELILEHEKQKKKIGYEKDQEIEKLEKKVRGLSGEIERLNSRGQECEKVISEKSIQITGLEEDKKRLIAEGKRWKEQFNEKENELNQSELKFYRAQDIIRYLQLELENEKQIYNIFKTNQQGLIKKKLGLMNIENQLKNENQMHVQNIKQGESASQMVLQREPQGRKYQEDSRDFYKYNYSKQKNKMPIGHINRKNNSVSSIKDQFPKVRSISTTYQVSQREDL